MDIALLSSEGCFFLLRWLHFLAGITWIGLLYYFNFVQVPFMGEAGTEAGRPIVTRFLAPRALWWFRWGAMLTFLSGLTYLGLWVAKGGSALLSQNWGVTIQTGALLGTIMFLNVWLVIWPNQRIIINSANAVAGGGAADPAAGPAAPKAFLASRTNTLFSIPMLFFMGSASHLNIIGEGEHAMVPTGIIVAIIALLEGNALMGKRNEGISKILEKPVTVIHAGLGLALVFYLLLEFLSTK